MSDREQLFHALAQRRTNSFRFLQEEFQRDIRRVSRHWSGWQCAIGELLVNRREWRHLARHGKQEGPVWKDQAHPGFYSILTGQHMQRQKRSQFGSPHGRMAFSATTPSWFRDPGKLTEWLQNSTSSFAKLGDAGQHPWQHKNHL